MGVKRRPIITVQYPDGTAKRLRDEFHKCEADSGSADDLHAALDTIIEHPTSTLRRVLPKRDFRGRKPAKRGDEDAQLKEAVQGIAAAVT